MAEVAGLNWLRSIATSLVFVSHARPFALNAGNRASHIPAGLPVFLMALLCAYITAIILYFIGEKHHHRLCAFMSQLIKKRIGAGA